MKKYVVIWHESNYSGNPANVMGASGPFDSWEKAKGWIDGAICEDEARSKTDRNESLDVCPNAGDRVWRTTGNGQDTYYHVEELELPDNTEVERLLEATDAIRDIEESATSTLLTKEQALKKIRRTIVEYKNPLREFEVQVIFSPASVVKVMARNEKDAEDIVNAQIDNRTFSLTREQKTGIVEDILDNVVYVKKLGGGDDSD